VDKQEDIRRLELQAADLKRENKGLKAKIASLQDENDGMAKELEELRSTMGAHRCSFCALLVLML
jgi:regulator of replication initiation timing